MHNPLKQKHICKIILCIEHLFNLNVNFLAQCHTWQLDCNLNYQLYRFGVLIL